MSNYAKLINGVLAYAPYCNGNVLGYNLECNAETLLADGYKPVVQLENKDIYIDCEGYYSFNFIETDTAIEEQAVYHPYGYQQLRKQAYPEASELCDALVKINSGKEDLQSLGQQQLAAYVQTCLQIKAKYPKSI